MLRALTEKRFNDALSLTIEGVVMIANGNYSGQEDEMATIDIKSVNPGDEIRLSGGTAGRSYQVKSPYVHYAILDTVGNPWPANTEGVRAPQFQGIYVQSGKEALVRPSADTEIAHITCEDDQL